MILNKHIKFYFLASDSFSPMVIKIKNRILNNVQQNCACGVKCSECNVVFEEDMTKLMYTMESMRNETSYGGNIVIRLEFSLLISTNYNVEILIVVRISHSLFISVS